jgi:hypothetical protein
MVTRIYTGSDGQSHFEELDFPGFISQIQRIWSEAVNAANRRFQL